MFDNKIVLLFLYENVLGVISALVCMFLFMN